MCSLKPWTIQKENASLDISMHNSTYICKEYYVLKYRVRKNICKLEKKEVLATR